MSSPFLGEIRMFGGNFAPRGWALCQGQLMAIDQNTALFQLLGTTYGGDGIQTFALPDLRGRIPMHQGSGFVIGQLSGTETVTLTTQQIPSHSHAPFANTAAAGKDPTNSVPGGGGGAWFAPGVPSISMAANMIGNSGGSQPHDNMMPYLAVNFILALEGIFPSQN